MVKIVMEEIKKVANSFKTFDNLFSSLEKGDYSVLSRECGTNNYPEITWLIEFFLEKEEYEKCNFLSELKIPEPSKDILDKELRWLTDWKDNHK